MSASATFPVTHKVLRMPLAWTLAPERAALLVRDDVRPFALIGRWAGGGALIGSDPVRVASPDDDPFALLDEQPSVADANATPDASAAPDANATPDASAAPDANATPAVAGGWFGYLGYELGRRLEPVGAGPPIAGRLPAFELAFYDHLLRLDDHGRWWFEALWSAPRDAALRERLRELEARAARAPQPRPFASEAWQATPGAEGHQLAVDACRTRIYEGDLFQANICARLQSRLRGDPVDLFAAAVEQLGPDRSAFLAGPWGAIASLSPELFLERHGRDVRSVPIKGTRRRPQDPQAAARERDALLASAKDRAENVMIVDLVRNDLGRVCVPGSIAVQALWQARAHAGVWHLVSEVAGVLPEEVGDSSLVRAAFPPGSVTGAPKVAALNVIAELESSAREVYTGAIGFASPVAGLELSVAIRTFEFRGEYAWLGVGGGIVADSDPVAEAAECVTKARPLLDAIGARLAAEEAKATVPSASTTAPAPRRLGPRPVPRPDPAAGVFETLLVVDGRPVELGRHLARLERSVATLYSNPLPPGLADELLAVAEAHGRARLRVNARPQGQAMQIDFELTEVAERRVPVRLVPTAVPGGLGAHKWIDRGLLEAWAAGGDGEPLLCDLDGLVLETARASVFALDASGALLTPPTDGRILPGVTRARVLELARALALQVTVRPIALGELAQAGELFVTGALGGVEPAHLDGRPSAPSRGPITARLADALGRPEAASLTAA